MADKQDRWLDRETAERLLRGESPADAVAPEARDQAERLSRTLGALAALSAEPAAADEELPGEAAALKAFSEARAAREPGGALIGDKALSASHAADAGLVRIGGRGHDNGTRRFRWSRPARFGLVTALALGMAGGVALAAGTGLLPTPFDGAEPAPGASVSAPAGPDRPLVSPSPDASGTTGADKGKAEEGTGGGDGGTTGDDSRGTAAPGTDGTWPKGVTSSCRDVRAGRTLNTERRRTLEDLAGGWPRVPAYCADVLGHLWGGTSGTTKDHGGDNGSTGHDGRGSDSGGRPGSQNGGPAGTTLGQGGQGGQGGHSGGAGTTAGGNGDHDGDHGGGASGGHGHHDNGAAAAPSSSPPTTL